MDGSDFKAHPRDRQPHEQESLQPKQRPQNQTIRHHAWQPDSLSLQYRNPLPSPPALAVPKQYPQIHNVHQQNSNPPRQNQDHRNGNQAPRDQRTAPKQHLEDQSVRSQKLKPPQQNYPIQASTSTSLGEAKSSRHLRQDFGHQLRNSQLYGNPETEQDGVQGRGLDNHTGNYDARKHNPQPLGQSYGDINRQHTRPPRLHPPPQQLAASRHILATAPPQSQPRPHKPFEKQVRFYPSLTEHSSYQSRHSTALWQATHIVFPFLFFILFAIFITVAIVYTLSLSRPLPSKFLEGIGLTFGIILLGWIVAILAARVKRNAEEDQYVADRNAWLAEQRVGGVVMSGASVSKDKKHQKLGKAKSKWGWRWGSQNDHKASRFSVGSFGAGKHYNLFQTTIATCKVKWQKHKSRRKLRESSKRRGEAVSLDIGDQDPNRRGKGERSFGVITERDLAAWLATTGDDGGRLSQLSEVLVVPGGPSRSPVTVSNSNEEVEDIHVSGPADLIRPPAAYSPGQKFSSPNPIPIQEKSARPLTRHKAKRIEARLLSDQASSNDGSSLGTPDRTFGISDKFRIPTVEERSSSINKTDIGRTETVYIPKKQNIETDSPSINRHRALEVEQPLAGSAVFDAVAEGHGFEHPNPILVSGSSGRKTSMIRTNMVREPRRRYEPPPNTTAARNYARARDASLGVSTPEDLATKTGIGILRDVKRRTQGYQVPPPTANSSMKKSSIKRSGNTKKIRNPTEAEEARNLSDSADPTTPQVIASQSRWSSSSDGVDHDSDPEKKPTTGRYLNGVENLVGLEVAVPDIDSRSLTDGRRTFSRKRSNALTTLESFDPGFEYEIQNYVGTETGREDPGKPRPDSEFLPPFWKGKPYVKLLTDIAPHETSVETFQVEPEATPALAPLSCWCAACTPKSNPELLSPVDLSNLQLELENARGSGENSANSANASPRSAVTTIWDRQDDNPSFTVHDSTSTAPTIRSISGPKSGFENTRQNQEVRGRKELDRWNRRESYDGTSWGKELDEVVDVSMDSEELNGEGYWVQNHSK